MRQLHATAAVPQFDSPLFPIIQRCLARNPARDTRISESCVWRWSCCCGARPVKWFIHRASANSRPANGISKGTASRPWGAGRRPSPATIGLWRWIHNAQRLGPTRGSASAPWGGGGGHRLYRSGIEPQPFYADAWNNKGSVLIDLGRLQEAISCFERALALDPRNARRLEQQGGQPGQTWTREQKQLPALIGR